MDRLGEDFKEMFAHHPPSNENVIRAHEVIREKMRETTKSIAGFLPDSRERSLFITKMQEAAMFANACVALKQVEYV